jgi:hypothetical protein
MNCRVEIEIVIASFLLIRARKTVDAGLHQAVGGELSSFRSKPGRIGGSGSADFILCAYAIEIEHQAALPGFDLELRVIAQRNGRLFTRSREFTHSDAIHLAKFNILTVVTRGTMLAEVISAERKSKIIQHHP